MHHLIVLFMAHPMLIWIIFGIVAAEVTLIAAGMPSQHLKLSLVFYAALIAIGPLSILTLVIPVATLQRGANRLRAVFDRYDLAGPVLPG